MKPIWMVPETRLEIVGQKAGIAFVTGLGRATVTAWKLLRSYARLMAVCGMLLSVQLNAIVISIYSQELPADEVQAFGRPSPDILREGTLPFDAEMYLPDATGQRVFVPNMTIAELLKLRELADGNASSFQFESIQVEADARDTIADLTASFTILLESGISSAEIPLRFGSCQLGLQDPQIQNDPATEFKNQFKADAAGYRWILAPKLPDPPSEASRHKITLEGKSRIPQEADRRSLKISLPQALCRIRLKLPANAIDERVRAEDVFQREVVDDGIVLNVDCRGGDFEVSWRTQESVTNVSAVEAQSQSTFTLGDPRDIWNVNTTLTVRWYGNDANDSFRVRLPKRGRWRAFPEDDFERFKISSVMPADQFSESDDSDSGGKIWDQDSTELVVVNLDPGQNRLIELPLEWEWMPESGEDPASIASPLPSLSVEEVNLHRGLVNLVCPSTYLILFNEGADIGLIQRRRLTDAFGSQQLQFRFDRQDYKLNLQFRREQTLPTIRPTYQVAVDRNKLVMTAWLDCSFDVNQRPYELGLIFGNWIPQDNTARILADPTDLFSDEGELLRVDPQTDGSYRISKATTEAASFGPNRRIQQVWRIVAERAWRPDENQLQFDIPSIIRGRDAEPDHGSGVLIVSSTDEILLQWQDTPFRGLLPDSFSADYEQFISRDPIRRPLAYRFQSQGDTPAWSGSVELLPQLLTTKERTQLQITDRSAYVQQEFDLQIANVPLERPQVAIRSNATSVEPQFFVDGVLTTARFIRTLSSEELASLLSDEPEGEDPENTWALYQLIGASPLQRSATIRITTNVPWQPQAAEEPVDNADENPTTEVDIPLARLLPNRKTRVLQRSLQIESDFQVSLRRPNSDSTVWKNVESDQAISLQPDESSLRLRVQQSAKRDEAQTIIERSWLQTAVNDSIRQDRFVAKVQTSASELRLRLPDYASVRPSPLVFVDGIEQASTYLADQDIMLISLGENGTQPHTVEVIYSSLSNLQNWTSLRVSVPSILGAEFGGRFYWQLATPRTQHLSWAPKNLVPEWRWQWGNLFWYRQSSMEEGDLVRLFDASDARIPSSANTYLMSGQAPAVTYQARIVTRYLFWLPVGIFAIVVAMLVINFSFFRQPLAGMILALLVAGVAMSLPDIGVLLGQTAVIALSLVALVVLTNAAIESRVRRRSVFTARPTSTHIERSGTIPSLRSSSGTANTEPRKGSSIVAGGGKS